MSIINKKPLYSCKIGSISVKIYHSTKNVRNCYMTMDVPCTGEYHRIDAANPLYGQCLTCAVKNDTAALNSAIGVFTTVNRLLFASQKNLDTYIKASNSIVEGLFKTAEDNAVKTSEAQEQADEALMREAVEYANISKKERKKRREQMKETVREIIEDNGREN